MSTTEGAFDRNSTNVNVVYYLYLASIVLGVTAIIGVIMAFMNRLGTGDWLDSHYTYQIRTFWIGLLYFAIGVVLTMIVIGAAVIVATLVWWIVRCAKGMQRLSRGQAYENPATWLW